MCLALNYKFNITSSKRQPLCQEYYATSASELYSHCFSQITHETPYQLVVLSMFCVHRRTWQIAIRRYDDIKCTPNTQSIYSHVWHERNPLADRMRTIKWIRANSTHTQSARTSCTTTMWDTECLQRTEYYRVLTWRFTSITIRR